MFQSSLDEILHEVDDLDQEPGEDEIREYAELIGINPDTEPDLLWIARAGITAPLPADWKPIQVNNGDELYFYNFKTGESSWEHPSDDKYRKMVVEERSKKSKQKLEGGGGSKSIQPKGPEKPAASASVSTEGTAISPLKPLKHPSPAGAIGKLAPLGGIQPPSAPPGKLQPIGSETEAVPSRVGAKTLAPIGPSAKVQERPKTSRGPPDKGKEEAEPQQIPKPLGGGNRFLKKDDDTKPTEKSDAQQHHFVQNVLRFPSEDSESESLSLPGSVSEVASAPNKDIALGVSSILGDQKAVERVQPVTTQLNSKPPVAPKPAVQVNKETSQVIYKAPSATAKLQPEGLGAEKLNTNQQSSRQSAGSAEPSVSEQSENKEKVRRQLQEEYEHNVKQLREQHDGKLKDVKLKFDEEEKKEVDKIRRAMDDRLRSFKEKLHNETENETKALTASHKKEMEEIRRKYDQERVDLEKDLRAKLEATRKQLQADGEREIAASENVEAKSLQANHKEAVAALKSRLDNELAEEKKRCEDEKRRKKEEMRIGLQKELDEWCKKERERRVAVLKSDVGKEVAQMKNSLAAEQQSIMEREVATELERRRRELEAEKERQLTQLKREYEQELHKDRRRNKELLDDDNTGHQRRADRVNIEAFSDLRERQEEALRTAEQQLKGFREELSALTQMAVEIRQTIQLPQAPSAANDSAVKRNGMHPPIAKQRNQTDPEKAGLVKSIDHLISPDTECDKSSGAASSREKMLNELASEDVMDKVTRFLESHKQAGSSRHRSLADRAVPPAAAPFGALTSQNGTYGDSRNCFTPFVEKAPAETVRNRRDLFRIRPKDAIDSFLDRKIEEYFQPDAVFSNHQNHVRYPPSSLFNYHGRYYSTFNRAYDVESELNSLKRWLGEFEDRVTQKGHLVTAGGQKWGGGLLPAEDDQRNTQAGANQITYSDETVDI